jgi:glycosyltransferase involved in cell wall biosynthesis
MIAKREVVYRAGCSFAQTVVVGSQWVKDDVLAHYGPSADKVQVIPEHPPTILSPELKPEFLLTVSDKYQLRQPFAVYPAVTWLHKNHIRLFEALARLRDEGGLTVRLVCTGSIDEKHWPRLMNCINELRLEEQIKFLGFVPEAELRAIYRLSEFLVMPSLFEASSLPVFEAWLEGTPVTCSNVTALPDQVMEAGLLFDPTDTAAIANAVARMATDELLREQLRLRAYRRLQDFDWRRTAKTYRAVYRRAAGRHLADEDRRLLSWDWMKNPEQEMVVA